MKKKKIHKKIWEKNQIFDQSDNLISWQKNCTKTNYINRLYKQIIQNNKFVDILYTKIVIKILYDNECIKNVHHIPTYIQKMYKLYKTCTKFRLKTAWNLKCMFFVLTNNVWTITKPIQLAN